MNNKDQIRNLGINWAKMWEDGILNAWSDRLTSKYGSINEAWDRKAAEYDKDLEHSNRVKFLDKIERHSPQTVLDVGAGSGVFAIPLAKRVKRVVAVEPSPGMLDILKKKAESYNLTNIEYINKKWEDVSVDTLIEINNGEYDAVICSHALYYITNLHNSFKKMNDISKGHVYLLIIADEDLDNTYLKLWERLHKKTRSQGQYPDYACLYMVLREIGLHPNIEILDTYAKIYIKSIDECIDRWKDDLDLDSEPTEHQRDAIREYLSDKIKEEDGNDDRRLYWEWRSKDAVFHWRTVTGK